MLPKWEGPTPETTGQALSLRKAIDSEFRAEQWRARIARMQAQKERHNVERGVQPTVASFAAVRDPKPPPVTRLPRPQEGDKQLNFTNSVGEKHRLTEQAWRAIFNRFEAGTLPSYREWKGEYEDLIKRVECHLPRLRGRDFLNRLRKVKISGAAGADSWRVPEALELPLVLLDRVAEIFQAIERGGGVASSSPVWTGTPPA